MRLAIAAADDRISPAPGRIVLDRSVPPPILAGYYFDRAAPGLAIQRRPAGHQSRLQAECQIRLHRRFSDLECEKSTGDNRAMLWRSVRFAPKVRAAAKRVAAAAHIADDWLNDAVKGYVSDKGEFDQFLELPNLRVMTASPKYLLAMKCLAMRLGAEFLDENDVRFLLRYLEINNYEAAVGVISHYYPLERFPQKTLYALEEICAECE